jgi:capsular polysaccharide transport system permease protein
MSTSPASAARHSNLMIEAFATQCRVIGAIILRELHTRYGRENIGYLWVIGEPMLLATVIGLLHVGNHATSYIGNVRPIPFAVMGYTTFILFRGIVNRSSGSLEVNAPLLYHKQVTLLDLTVARAILEFAGCFVTFLILMSLLIMTGLADPPVRPLIVILAWALIFWYSLAHSILIASSTYENRTAERLIHPYSYFMVGLSASFFQVGWVPHPYREWLGYIPLTSIFELERYGMFSGTNLDFYYGEYVFAACAVLTWIGLIMMRRVHQHVHLP